MMNVLVFKTSIETIHQVTQVAPKLNALAGKDSWNFDLTDCDRILRIVNNKIEACEAIRLLQSIGFACCELEDEVVIIPETEKTYL